MPHLKAKFLWFAVITMAWVLTFPSLAQISFEPSVTYPTGSWPWAVGIGDCIVACHFFPYCKNHYLYSVDE